MMRDDLFVANDTYLDNGKNRISVITGPNMAGKSTYMRQTALIVLMAQIGSVVPADESNIGSCDRIFTRCRLYTSQMRGLVKAVSAEEKTAWDREVCRRVLSRPEIAGADRILGYMALSWETGTRKLLEKLLREGKRVALPRVVMDGKNSQEKGPWMVFFEIRSLDDLEEGAFHILEMCIRDRA